MKEGGVSNDDVGGRAVALAHYKATQQYEFTVSVLQELYIQSQSQKMFLLWGLGTSHVRENLARQP